MINSSVVNQSSQFNNNISTTNNNNRHNQNNERGLVSPSKNINMSMVNSIGS